MIFRESNHVADHLANRGHSVSFGFQVVEHSDPNLCYWLHYDHLDISEKCLIMNES
ncbi:hypothetical protein LINPERPRIM_LOCUS9202 [Linum perenne]